MFDSVDCDFQTLQYFYLYTNSSGEKYFQSSGALELKFEALVLVFPFQNFSYWLLINVLHTKHMKCLYIYDELLN